MKQFLTIAALLSTGGFLFAQDTFEDTFGGIPLTIEEVVGYTQELNDANRRAERRAARYLDIADFLGYESIALGMTVSDLERVEEAIATVEYMLAAVVVQNEAIISSITPRYIHQNTLDRAADGLVEIAESARADATASPEDSELEEAAVAAEAAAEESLQEATDFRNSEV